MPVPQGPANNMLADAKTSGEVARVLADALGGGDRPVTLDAMLDALPGNPHGPGATLAIASPAMADAGHYATFGSANFAFGDALAVHHDAPPLA